MTPRAEQRRSPRHACERRVEVIPFATAAERRAQTVELADCSLGGLRFTSPASLSPGDLFTVQLEVDGRQRMFIYTCRHCTPDVRRPKSYSIGAELSGYIADVNEQDPERVLAGLTGRRV